MPDSSHFVIAYIHNFFSTHQCEYWYFCYCISNRADLWTTPRLTFLKWPTDVFVIVFSILYIDYYLCINISGYSNKHTVCLKKNFLSSLLQAYKSDNIIKCEGGALKYFLRKKGVSDKKKVGNHQWRLQVYGCTHCAYHERSDWPEICPANISAVN